MNSVDREASREYDIAVGKSLRRVGREEKAVCLFSGSPAMSISFRVINIRRSSGAAYARESRSPASARMPEENSSR